MRPLAIRSIPRATDLEFARETIAPAAAKLAVEAVSKSFSGRHGSVQALDRVSLAVRPGEIVCLVGPSGCGKSTLLDIMAGLARPDAGRVLAEGRPVTGPGPDRLVMFQEAGLFPWLDALGNVMFGLRLRKDLDEAARREIAHAHLALVGLKGFERAFAHQLSGGMRQRVALARALAPDPALLLMDEPFSALDALTRERLYEDVQRIFATTGKTAILVTHNVREAVCLGDRVVVMAPRPGRIASEHAVGLPRPRDVNSVALAEIAATIAADLKSIALAEETPR
ncbi:ABC transporter ATP-binding protein [Salinarimonas sp.]|uniref:ABC transporter ATP-binding protein n=1 Tax=Salinarimonas sp. TaxID=2766526 RepID=UPI00391B3C9A